MHFLAFYLKIIQILIGPHMLKNRKLPLNALHTFELLVRLGKLSETAKELNISESAISHQIKSLEAWFGCKLFDRSRRALRPSKNASRLAYVVEQSLLDIREACDAILDSNARHSLTVSCSAAFASIVILPLLWRFHESSPDIEIILKLERFSDPTSDADVSIRFADEASAKVIENKLGPVGWQCISAKSKPALPLCVSESVESFDFVMLAEDFDNPWEDFFTLPNNEQYLNPLRFSEMNLVCAAAVSGEGYAFVPKLLAMQLHNQSMVKPADDAVIRANSMYYYILPEEASSNKRQMRNQFISWLRDELSETVL